MPSVARDFPCFEFEISAVANQLALVLTYCAAAVVVNHSAASCPPAWTWTLLLLQCLVPQLLQGSPSLALEIQTSETGAFM